MSLKKKCSLILINQGVKKVRLSESESGNGHVKEAKKFVLKDKSNFKSNNGFKNTEKKSFDSARKFDSNKKSFDGKKKFDSSKPFNNSNKKFDTKKPFAHKQEGNGEKPVYTKKELKVQRKQKKLADNYDVSVNMKKIWETLRRFVEI